MSTELWPKNVRELHGRGVEFTHRPASRDVIARCPECGSRLILDERRPFFFCLGRGRCKTDGMNFAEVISKLR